MLKAAACSPYVGADASCWVQRVQQVAAIKVPHVSVCPTGTPTIDLVLHALINK
jgi:hypothetical protein